jgi:S-DNA-T family DNA segregation ATPase FtsK/SpoIIIE
MRVDTVRTAWRKPEACVRATAWSVPFTLLERRCMQSGFIATGESDRLRLALTSTLEREDSGRVGAQHASDDPVGVTRVPRLVRGQQPHEEARVGESPAVSDGTVAVSRYESYAPGAGMAGVPDRPLASFAGRPPLHDSLTLQQRRLIRDIAALTQSHAVGVDAVSTEFDRAQNAANIDLAKAREDAHTIHSKHVRSVENELKNALAEEKAAYDGAFTVAEATAKREVHEFVVQTNSLESKAKERLDEKHWLAETVYESAVKKAARDFEANQGAIEQRNQDLLRISATASELLRRGRFRPLPEATPLTAGIDDKPASAEVEMIESAAAAGRAIVLMETLQVRAFPFILNPGFVIGGVLAAGAAGAIAAAVMYANTPQLTEMLGYYAAAGVGAASIIGLVVRVVVRSRVPHIAGDLSRALAQATWINNRATVAMTGQRDQYIAAAKEKRESEKASALSREKINLEGVAQRRAAEEPALRAIHAAVAKELTQRHERNNNEIKSRAASRRAKAQSVLDAAVAKAEEVYAGAMAKATAERDTRTAELLSRWNSGIASCVAAYSSIMRAVAPQQPGWKGWGSFESADYVAPTSVPDHVTFGSYVVGLDDLPGGIPPGERASVEAALGGGGIELPLAIDLKDKGSLLIQHNEQSRTDAILALNDVMLRIMASFPPSKARFTIIDPVGLGQSFAAFAHLADIDEKLVHDKIWTDPKHIEQRLSDLTDHMETVIQKYLRNEYETIQEYNAHAGEVAEPYRFLVIADYPAQLSEQASKRLASIISSGPRCGVFTLIAHDLRSKALAWLPTAELQRASVWLRYENAGGVQRCVRQDPDFTRWPLTLEAPPSDSSTTSVLKIIGGLSKELGRVRVPFEITAPRGDAQVWSLSSSSDVNIPLGRSGATKLQYMTLGRGTAQHALIAGRTGSGKSTLLHVIIMNLALWYSPDEIEMYLVDFKKGVEFKAYATHGLPHARVIAIESEREFGLSVLRRLDAELTRRGQLFRDNNVQDVAAYRARTSGRMPRVLLLVDEFQEFFVEDDKVAQEASLLLDRLVRQGRAFGMHVVLGSQTLGGAYSLARSTLGQMAVRIALQCSEADSYVIMSEDNPAPRLLSRPGEAIYNDASGLIEGNSPFQIVWLPEEIRDDKLRLVRDRDAARDSKLMDRPAAIVFEGNLPALIEQNHHLLSLEREERVLAPTAPVSAWLGEAISIKDPSHMIFRRQSASNILIVGQQEDAAAVMVRAMARSIAAHTQHRPMLVAIDSTPADSPEYGKLEAMVRSQRNISQIDELNLTPFAGPRGSGASMVALAAEVKRREELSASETSPIFVLIMGLHRFRDLRKQDDFSFGSESSDTPKPDKALAAVLRDGAAVGVHVVAWCDTAASVDRTLERQSTREFEAKVLFQMSANDSTNLIDLPVAASLGRNRALLHREELGTVEKFRPYANA